MMTASHQAVTLQPALPNYLLVHSNHAVAVVNVLPLVPMSLRQCYLTSRRRALLCAVVPDGGWRNA